MKNKFKTFKKKTKIKAKIANGIWKFRTKFWNDSIKLYSGHVVHSSETFLYFDKAFFETLRQES